MARTSDPFSGKTTSSSFNVTNQFNRVGHVEIDFGTDSTYSSGAGRIAVSNQGKFFSFEGLDFKFRISQICDEYPKGFAEISILGLKEDTINRLTELTTQDQALRHKKRVRVYAGYADETNPNYKGDLICDMDIVYATPTTPPPEVWVTITAGIRIDDKYRHFAISLPEMLTEREGNKFHNNSYEVQTTRHDWKIFEFTTTKTVYPLKTLCGDVVRIINEQYEKIEKETGSKLTKLELDFRAPEYYGKFNMKDRGFHPKSTDVSGIIKEMNTLDPYKRLKFFIENGTDGKSDLLVCKELGLNESLDEQQSSTSNIKYLDMYNGMVGLPSIVQGNEIRCRCLLTPGLRMLDWVKITSTIIPKMNGYWQVREITHNGHFRGNEWYTDICGFDPEKLNLDGTTKGNGSSESVNMTKA